VWHGHLGLRCRPTLGLNCAAGKFDRWHHATTRNAHEKRAKFEAAPAASIAGHVGRLVLKELTVLLFEEW